MSIWGVLLIAGFAIVCIGLGGYLVACGGAGRWLTFKEWW